MKPWKAYIYRIDRFWIFVLVASNGVEFARSSQRYTTRYGAVRGARRLAGIDNLVVES